VNAGTNARLMALLAELLDLADKGPLELRLELGGSMVTVAVKPAGDRRAGPPSLHAGAAQQLAALAERGVTVRQVRVVTEPR
jgi:hypothetical protein